MFSILFALFSYHPYWEETITWINHLSGVFYFFIHIDLSMLSLLTAARLNVLVGVRLRDAIILGQEKE